MSRIQLWNSNDPASLKYTLAGKNALENQLTYAW